MLTPPTFLPNPCFALSHHIPGHNNATTPVGMYFRYRIGPLEAIDVIQCEKAIQLVCSGLVECSLPPHFCPTLVLLSPTTYRAITMPQHPLACISDIGSVH